MPWNQCPGAIACWRTRNYLCLNHFFYSVHALKTNVFTWKFHTEIFMVLHFARTDFSSVKKSFEFFFFILSSSFPTDPTVPWSYQRSRSGHWYSWYECGIQPYAGWSIWIAPSIEPCLLLNPRNKKPWHFKWYQYTARGIICEDTDFSHWKNQAWAKTMTLPL